MDWVTFLNIRFKVASLCVGCVCDVPGQGGDGKWVWICGVGCGCVNDACLKVTGHGSRNGRVCGVWVSKFWTDALMVIAVVKLVTHTSQP